jgi:hypothetical protein
LFGGTGETTPGDNGSVSSIENPNNFAIIYFITNPSSIY